MKNPVRFLLLFLIFNFSIVNNLQSQENCKVLKIGIDSTYQGACKRDLAHGVGEAWGVDHYFGEFRRGYPEGKGTYEYANGALYVGGFLKGLRHGYGEFTPVLENGDTTYAGTWKRDKYIGPERKGSPYRIIDRQNVDRFKVVRTGDENKVMFTIQNNFTAKPDIYEFTINNSSGVGFKNASWYGFNNVTFPFTLHVRFIRWNRLATGVQEVIFEIELFEEGEWRVEVY